MPRPSRPSTAAFLLGLVAPFLTDAQHARNTTLLLDKAKTLLLTNFDAEQGWTVPSKATAPYLDSTSSLFTAYAYAKFDPDAGMKELIAWYALQSEMVGCSFWRGNSMMCGRRVKCFCRL
jgi:ABC-type proline/glycine betaine transport system substrate-binding protein